MAEHPAGAASPASADNGLGVPPFRPAPPPNTYAPGPTQLKDPAMARPPFAAPTSNPSPVQQPTPPAQPTASIMPGGPARPANASVIRPQGREAQQEKRTLVVGRGISVQGMVQDAERLVVEGQVEATMIHATELSVSPGGVFKGEVEVEDAEVAGTIDGTVVARGNLIVRNTGVVLGTARCRRLQVEDGGQITGRIEMLTEARAPATMQARQAAEVA